VPAADRGAELVVPWVDEYWWIIEAPFKTSTGGRSEARRGLVGSPIPRLMMSFPAFSRRRRCLELGEEIGSRRWVRSEEAK
jgi:hypothetical protein